MQVRGKEAGRQACVLYIQRFCFDTLQISGVSKGFSLRYVGLKPNLNFTPILISRMPGSIPAKQPQAISRPFPTQIPGHNAILPGTDWYPEQWPESPWEEDLRLMEAAHIKVVRIAEAPSTKLLLCRLHVEVTWFAVG